MNGLLTFSQIKGGLELQANMSKYAKRKDVVFVLAHIVSGIQAVQFPFPYTGTAISASTSFSQDVILTSDFIYDIECYKNDSWVTIGEITLQSGSTSPSIVSLTNSSVIIDENATIRINVKSCQDGLSNVTIMLSLTISA